MNKNISSHESLGAVHTHTHTCVLKNKKIKNINKKYK